MDPLDAFMATEVNPEVKAKEAQEQQRKAEERKLFAKQLAVCILPELSVLTADLALLPQCSLSCTLCCWTSDKAYAQACFVCHPHKHNLTATAHLAVAMTGRQDPKAG